MCPALALPSTLKREAPRRGAISLHFGAFSIENQILTQGRPPHRGSTTSRRWNLWRSGWRHWKWCGYRCCCRWSCQLYHRTYSRVWISLLLVRFRPTAQEPLRSRRATVMPTPLMHLVAVGSARCTPEYTPEHSLHSCCAASTQAAQKPADRGEQISLPKRLLCGNVAVGSAGCTQEHTPEHSFKSFCMFWAIPSEIHRFRRNKCRPKNS